MQGFCWHLCSNDRDFMTGFPLKILKYFAIVANRVSEMVRYEPEYVLTVVRTNADNLQVCALVHDRL